MTDLPYEVESHRHILHDVYGSILIVGLGLGVFFSCIQKYKKIHIVEADEDVINLVSPYFKHKKNATYFHSSIEDFIPPQKYDFILIKEKKEKERKVIEAEGQRDAQKIINESLSTNYLYYLYINELKDREGTVYVPTSPGTGMPLFRDLGR